MNRGSWIIVLIFKPNQSTGKYFDIFCAFLPSEGLNISCFWNLGQMLIHSLTIQLSCDWISEWFDWPIWSFTLSLPERRGDMLQNQDRWVWLESGYLSSSFLITNWELGGSGTNCRTGELLSMIDCSRLWFILMWMQPQVFPGVGGGVFLGGGLGVGVVVKAERRDRAGGVMSDLTL